MRRLLIVPPAPTTEQLLAGASRDVTAIEARCDRCKHWEEHYNDGYRCSRIGEYLSSVAKDGAELAVWGESGPCGANLMTAPDFGCALFEEKS